MGSILIVGIILFVGFVSGELAKLVRLPKVTGYIISGVILNPNICRFIPYDFPEHTDLVTNIALAFIVFSVGGTLLYSKIKKLGKIILSITFFEAEFAFITVSIIFAAFSHYFIQIPGASFMNVFIPLGLLTASLAAPTDPSATLAVIHEYKAKGQVSSTIMGIAASDDILGIINYSLAGVGATVLIKHASLSQDALVVKPMILIFGSILLGVIFGLILNAMTKMVRRETEGMLIVLIFGLISLCFGVASLLKLEELLAVVAMGAIVVNFNYMHVKIFNMLGRYTEELILVLFFTISGMHLNFSVIANNWALIILFVLFRTFGKYLGVVTGSFVSKAPKKIKRYVAGGLIPQGGIVVGLALLIRQNSMFSSFSDILLNIVIGATVIHELIGPICAKISIVKAGEIGSSA